MNKTQKMKALTIRFSEETWDLIREVAAKHHVSAAELVRQMVLVNMSKQDNRLLDPEQEEQMRSEMQALRGVLLDVLNEISKVRLELNRIGVNYNQEIKLKNIERKYRGVTDMYSLQQKFRETEAVTEDSQLLRKDEIDAIMQRFRDAVQKAGEALCHILA